MGITEEDADGFVHQVARDWTEAPLSPADQALCRLAEQLTAEPASVAPADIDTLRKHGFDDTAIHDATQVIAYFNYINRIADGLAVEDEDFVRAWGEE